MKIRYMKRPFYYTDKNGIWHLLAEIDLPISIPETNEEVEALEE